MIGGRGDVSCICEKNEKDIQNLKPYDQKEPLCDMVKVSKLLNKAGKMTHS